MWNRLSSSESASLSNKSSLNPEESSVLSLNRSKIIAFYDKEDVSPFDYPKHSFEPSHVLLSTQKLSNEIISTESQETVFIWESNHCDEALITDHYLIRGSNFQTWDQTHHELTFYEKLTQSTEVIKEINLSN